jgi:hypothetical protein
MCKHLKICSAKPNKKETEIEGTELVEKLGEHKGGKTNARHGLQTTVSVV